MEKERLKAYKSLELPVVVIFLPAAACGYLEHVFTVCSVTIRCHCQFDKFTDFVENYKPLVELMSCVHK